MAYPKELKAVLIDFDGTLIDSMPFLFQAYCEILLKRGIKPSESEFKELIGPTIREGALILQQRHSLKESVRDILQEWSKSLIPLYEEGLKPLPGAMECIAYMKARWKVALVTSAERPLVDPFLKRNNLAFNLIVSKEDGLPSKPSPMPYREALRRLHINAQEAIAIEDSDNGVRSSLAAGIFTLKLEDGKQAFECTEAHPVADWKQIKEWIESRYG